MSAMPPAPQPPGAQPSAPAPDDARATIPTEENPPLSVDGRLQPKNFPAWGKWLGAAIVAVATSIAAAWGVLKPVVEDYHRIATQKAESAERAGAKGQDDAKQSYSTLAPHVDGLEKRVAALEADRDRDRVRARRRPAAPAPHLPPLPRDLKAAEAQAAKAAPPAQGPPSATPADAAGP